MGNIFNQDFHDFIQVLNDHNVEYILVGGYSVIVYGHSRTTGDLDIWVNRTKDNYEKISKAFTSFGMGVFEMTEENFLFHPEWDVFRFGRAPVAIDIMIKVKGLEFENSFKSSVIKEVEGLSVRILNYDNLITSKRSAGRNKDIDDINSLEKK